ncbi:MAG TPA: ECF-type sigma factor [Gemmataceae bacterium]|nr:ECF-type sigma factor [Gemmataceae bacterium]
MRRVTKACRRPAGRGAPRPLLRGRRRGHAPHPHRPGAPEGGRHSGGRGRRDLDRIDVPAPEPAADLLAVDEALARFEAVDPGKAAFVKLRYFAGLTVPQAAEALGVAPSTADRHWAYARAWLHAELTRDQSAD